MVTARRTTWLARAVAGLMALAGLAGGDAPAREGYFEIYCSAAGCHTGTAPNGSTEDLPSCAACHYHGMAESTRRWKSRPSFRGWTGKPRYRAGDTVEIFITGGDQPGWIRARVLDHEGQEVARATGPTGMGDDGDPNWTASVLPGPIVLTARAPYAPGTYQWKVGWFGNIAYPNPPPVPAGGTGVAHRSYVLGWHDVPIPAFQVHSDDGEGPAVRSITASPSPTEGARDVTVSAIASDALSGRTPVSEARVRLMGPGVPPQADWIPMQAADGQFDSPDEVVRAALDVSNLTPASYAATLQARDILGNWGSPAQTVLEVTGASPFDGQAPSAACHKAVPALAPPGQPIHVEAVIDDRGSGASPIHGAEALPALPGGPGVPVTLEATDGAFDSPLETVAGTIRTDGLPDGSYEVQIQGRDAAGLWASPCQTAFEVRESSDAQGPVAAGHVWLPNPTRGATTSTLKVDISDLDRGYGRIAGAEIFLDPATAPGEGIPLLPDDGLLDRPRELLAGALATEGWPPGGYMVGVRGQDERGNWGPITWTSLQVSLAGPDEAGPAIVLLDVDPPFTHGAGQVTLEGRVLDSATGGSRPTLVEYFLDQPGPIGSGTAITLGRQRSPRGYRNPKVVARFQTVIDVSRLSADRTYSVYARSMDARGNWGPLAAAAFRVTR